jgi:hypothetical protein
MAKGRDRMAPSRIVATPIALSRRLRVIVNSLGVMSSFARSLWERFS